MRSSVPRGSEQTRLEISAPGAREPISFKPARMMRALPSPNCYCNTETAEKAYAANSGRINIS